MKKLFDEPIAKFLAFGLFLYVTWFALYEWYIHPMVWVDQLVVDNTLSISHKVLGLLGYVSTLTGNRVIGIEGTPGLFMGDSCNGIALFALYSIFILAFPGNVTSKIVFIPLGIALIHIMNVFRVVVLAIIETYSYSWTEFNHSYTFTIFIYGVIFMMWLFWINKYSSVKKKQG